MSAPTTERSVLVVSPNAETVGALTQYLVGAGLDARGGDSIEALAKHKPRRGPMHWVLFPDDFPFEAVDAAIAALERSTPRLTVILVTATPTRFTGLATGANVVVLGRPAWAWTILDAINGRLDTTGGADR